MFIVITLRFFFTPASADGLSMDSNWQVSSSLQDSSQYSSCNLNCLGSYYYHYYYFKIFFIEVLADGFFFFFFEFEWQQVSPSFQDSSQYSGRSEYSRSLDGLHSSSYFQVLRLQYQSFIDWTKSTNYNVYHCHFHVL